MPDRPVSLAGRRPLRHAVAALLAGLACATAGSIASAAEPPVLLDFEGVVPTVGEPPFGNRGVGRFYAEQGAVFSDRAWAVRSASRGNGLGNFINMPSGVSALFLLAPADETSSFSMQFERGAVGSFSFAYAARSSGSLSFYDAGGNCLPGLCGLLLPFVDQGQQGALFAVWAPFSVELTGTAARAEFSGRGNGIIFDDIVFSPAVPIPEPASALMLLAGLAGVAAAARRAAQGGTRHLPAQS